MEGVCKIKTVGCAIAMYLCPCALSCNSSFPKLAASIRNISRSRPSVVRLLRYNSSQLLARTFLYIVQAKNCKQGLVFIYLPRRIGSTPGFVCLRSGSRQVQLVTLYDAY